MTANWKPFEGVECRVLSRLLTHVPLRTGRWDDITKVERPMGQVDPKLTLVNVSYRANQ
jgi:hypothetical protein